MKEKIKKLLRSKVFNILIVIIIFFVGLKLYTNYISNLFDNSILHHLPVPKPVNAAFFDFCLQGMLSSAESASGQAVCIPTSICLTVFLGNGLTKSISKIFAPSFLAITFAASFVFPDNE